MPPVWVLVVAGMTLVVVIAWMLPETRMEGVGGDTLTYYGAVKSMLAGRGLYEFALPNGGLDPITFLYPPFAAMLMMVISGASLGSIVTGMRVLQFILSGVLTLVVIRNSGWVLPRESGLRDLARPTLAWALVLLSGPAIWSLALGQVSMLVAGLVILDLLLPPRWRGVLVGLAGAIKLTPMFFAVYFLVTRQWRQAINATSSFIGAALLTWLVLPKESWQYWTSVVFATNRIPDTDNPRNLTIQGVLESWSVPEAIARPLWLILVVGIAILAIRSGQRHHQRGEELSAILVIGLSSTLIGPVAWDHHLIWLPLIGVHLAFHSSPAARRAGWCLLILGSAVSPLWPHEADPVLWRKIIGLAPILVNAWIAVRGLPHRSDEPSAVLPGTSAACLPDPGSSPG